MPSLTAAVILAAGAGRRFAASVEAGGGPEAAPGRPAPGTQPGSKLLAEWNGRPVVAWSIEAAMAAGLAATFVVTGAAELRQVIPDGVTALANPHWTSGQASSLQVAVAAARAGGFDAVVVGLGDQPGIPAAAWRAVAASGAPIAVATYAGRRRNPVRLSRDIWDLLPRRGDQGARVLMAEHPELVAEVPCEGDPTDIDTVQDLLAGGNRAAGSGSVPSGPAGEGGR